MDEREHNEALIRELEPRLRELDDACGSMWDFVRGHAALVLRFVMPQSASRCVYIDCLSCSSISVVPSWEPVYLRIKTQEEESHTPLLLTDKDNLRVACRAVRLSVVETKGRESRSGVSMAGYSFLEVAERFREAQAHSTVDSFSSVTTFLDGYAAALQDNLLGVSCTADSALGFGEWLKKRFDWRETNAGWRDVIRGTFPDDRVAYGEFVNLLRLFREECADCDSGGCVSRGG